MPSTPQPAFEPRSTISRPSIPVKVPSCRAPTFRCVDLRGRRVRRLEVLAPREDEPHRTPERERGADCERLDEGELAAERAAERLGDDADVLEREVERARELPPRDERALRARGHDERARRLEPGGAHLRLEVCLVHPRRSERALDDRVARRERGLQVSPVARDAVEHVLGELLLAVVLLPVVDSGMDRLEITGLVVARFHDARERGAGLHRGLDVDDRLERLVLDERRLRAVLGGGLGLGDDERDGLSGEHDLLARERLGRAVGAGGRDRQVGRGEHGDHAGDGESRLPVDAEDARVRLGREHRARVQEAVDVPVGRVARRPRDLLGRVDTRARDADQARVVMRSSCARRRADSSARFARTARQLSPVLGGREAVAVDLRGCDRLLGVAVEEERRRADARERDRFPVGLDEGGRSREREARSGMLERRVRRPGAAARQGHDDVREQLRRGERRVNGPTRASPSGNSRSPSGERRRRRAPSASSTAGMSEAGSAWAMLPPIVPRFRTCRSPMPVGALR